MLATVIPTVVATVQAIHLPAVSIPTESVGAPEWIIETLKFIVTSKGLSIGGLVIALCQLLLKGLSVPFFADKAGKWKLLALYVIATIGTVVGFMVSGVPILGSLLAGPALGMFQNALHQIWQLFIAPKLEKKEV